MNGLVTVATVAILPVVLILIGLGDKEISGVDTTIRLDEVASRASNSLASATITITMAGVPNE